LEKILPMSSKEKQRRMFELVEQWKQSGETLKDFATFQGIALSGLQYWHKKYRDHRAPASVFIQMRSSGHTQLRLRYPNGVELMMPAGSPAALIAELIRLG